jgi:hypothetical protein
MQNMAFKLGSNQGLVDFYLLNSFDTQHQFVNTVKDFIVQESTSSSKMCEQRRRILLIQCDLSEKYTTQSFDLISCARYCLIELCKQTLASLENCFIVLLLNLQHDNIKLFSGKLRLIFV